MTNSTSSGKQTDPAPASSASSAAAGRTPAAPGSSADRDRRSGMIRLGGLWFHEKNGRKFWSGSFGSSSLFLFEANKRSETDPDLVLYIAESVRERR